ncbi:MAG: HAD family hydrolase [Bacteroidota bacterium]|nr:HAD family hydrolase [Bacteroidota bacterium]
MMPAESNYKAVLFDLDGTLINSLHDIADAMNRVLTARGFPAHTYDEYRTFIGRGLKNLAERSLPEGSKDEETVKVVHHDLMIDYGTHYINKTLLYKGIPELLDALSARQMKLAILSNKANEITQKIVGELLARWPFGCIMGPGGDIPRKPDPTGALVCSRKLDVEPQAILYLGDSGIDMQTAVAAGMHPVGVTWGFRSKEELIANGAVDLIDKPEELIELL